MPELDKNLILLAHRGTNTYLEVTAFPTKYALLDLTMTKQPTKTGHNSCSSAAHWVCTSSMVGFEGTHMVVTPTAHPLAVVLQTTLSLIINPESLRAFAVSPLTPLSDHSIPLEQSNTQSRGIKAKGTAQY
jgi:hypothetical protein